MQLHMRRARLITIAKREMSCLHGSTSLDLLGWDLYPEAIQYYCCAQFVVTKERIQRLPREFYLQVYPAWPHLCLPTINRHPRKKPRSNWSVHCCFLPCLSAVLERIDLSAHSDSFLRSQHWQLYNESEGSKLCWLDARCTAREQTCNAVWHKRLHMTGQGKSACSMVKMFDKISMPIQSGCSAINGQKSPPLPKFQVVHRWSSTWLSYHVWGGIELASLEL